MFKKCFASLLISSTLFSCAAFAETPETVSITFDGQTEEVSLSQMGLRVFTPDGNFLVNLFRKQKNSYRWNTKRVENVLYRSFSTQAAQNARYTLTEKNTVEVVPETEGVHFNADALMREITADYPRLESYTVNYSVPEVITAEALAAHTEQINTLMNEGLKISAEDEVHTYTAQLKDIFITQKDDAVEIELDAAFVDFVMDSLNEKVNRDPEDLHILEADPTQISYVKTEGAHKDGKQVMNKLTRTVIAAAISKGENTLEAVIDTIDAEIINETGLDLGPLEHISTGVSNYTGSDNGRTINVEKAMNEHYDDIIIPADAEFAFNEFLGPISTSAGWANAYIIVNGNQLKKSPGGGICQAATTVYRAALMSGMEINSRRNHSMYVNYYATPGITDTQTYDGLDATIYKGSQDLKFTNNTGHPVLVRAYTTEDQDAIVEFYGHHDGRQVTLEGPFTGSNATEEVTAAVGTLGSQKMAWKQIITWPDGTEQVDWILSRYRTTVKQY